MAGTQAHLRRRPRGLQQVVRAHARGQQRLVRVAHRRVRDQETPVAAHAPRPLVRAVLGKDVAPALEGLVLEVREDGDDGVWGGGRHAHLHEANLACRFVLLVAAHGAHG